MGISKPAPAACQPELVNEECHSCVFSDISFTEFRLAAVAVCEMVLEVSRATLKHILDNVERAAAAAEHAVSISDAAREAFEAEHKRLVSCTKDIAMLFSNL